MKTKQLSLPEEHKNCGDDHYVKAVLLAAAARGFTFHEETYRYDTPLYPKMITSGERGELKYSRFSVILGDGRLVSSVQFEERRKALSRICRALDRFMPQFEPNNRLTAADKFPT